MYAGKLVFAQLMDHLPWKSFARIVQRYGGDHWIRHLSCANQFRCMALAQLTYRESLRDIEACLRAQRSKLYHLGIHGSVARSTLADANEARDWRIYADFAQQLIGIARQLYAEEPFGLELKETVYALDATLIRLCLSLFPWATYRSTKAAVKLHTLLDLRGPIPAFIYISDGRLHELNILDQLLPEPGAFYIMDRAFVHFEALHRFHLAGAFFVLLTNNFALPALTIGELYRCRWQVELFFKWIKQHLRIKAFFGTSENAVKTQVWIAVSVYVLVAIIRKRLHLDAYLYELLQILSLTMFERTPLHQLLTLATSDTYESNHDNQLNLFEI